MSVDSRADPRWASVGPADASAPRGLEVSPPPSGDASSVDNRLVHSPFTMEMRVDNCGILGANFNHSVSFARIRSAEALPRS